MGRAVEVRGTDVTAAARTILVVDDEFSVVETLSEILTWEGYVVVTAADGPTALAALAAGIPDVVLLDYMMPGMSGLEVLERIRTGPATADLPVIMMTAAPLSGDGHAPTWNALLRKPFDVTALLRAIRGLPEPRSA